MSEKFTSSIQSHLTRQGFDCEATPKGEGLYLTISKRVDGEDHRAEMEVASSVIKKGARDYIEGALKGVVAQLKRNMR